ncbi:hypothetical protein [Paraflavitalea sp. CAU 1676]|uniref:hypothetical protein n=1 Tax=Paraflavitalea sp. CAU 1676 TaxID=3032598 RepID=UPI0023D9987B|nr:hypothetical protein [Paraflavitalea sp. CAU 1676]MDF2190306.1 hypothetical protein [Paraflavitalea sp. CAU 1676]
MILFWIMWAVDAVAALVILYFFVIGLGDNTVSDYNAGLWMTILGVLTIVLTGGLWLQSHQYPVAAKLLLLVIFVPAMLYLAYILMVLFRGGRWQ